MEEVDSITRFLLQRSVESLPQSELQTWATKRLLGRMKALWACMDWIDDREIYPEEVARVQGRVLLRGSTEWTSALTELKEVLATREHFPRGQRYSSQRQGRVAKTGQRRARR